MVVVDGERGDGGERLDGEEEVVVEVEVERLNWVVENGRRESHLGASDGGEESIHE